MYTTDTHALAFKRTRTHSPEGATKPRCCRLNEIITVRSSTIETSLTHSHSPIALPPLGPEEVALVDIGQDAKVGLLDHIELVGPIKLRHVLLDVEHLFTGAEPCCPSVGSST